MSKKVIKLINNERKNCKISSQKACDIGSNDVCTYIDAAECTVYATDVCDKDYVSCYNGADYTACSGAGAEDHS